MTTKASVRYVGRVVEWNDERGFGFVVPNGGHDRVFLHIKSFERQNRRPVDGTLVSYEIALDERERPRAAAVRFVRLAAGQEKPPARIPWRSSLGAAALCTLAVLWFADRLPGSIAVAYGVASALAFVVYGADKSAASQGRWRTEENTLHLLDLLGGWPGALVAQGMFRHKTRKAEFQFVFWITVIANVAVATWLAKGGWVIVERALSS